MKILFLALVDDVHGLAGNSIHIRELVKAFDSLGHSIHLIAGYNEKTICNNIDLRGSITVHYTRNLFKIPFPQSIFLSKMFLSSKIIKSFKPDLIYERNFNCYVGALLSKIFDIPLVVEINGLVDDEIELQGTTKNNSKIKRHILHWARKKSFIQTQKIVAVTDGIKNELQSTYHISPEKITVVANGANIDIFKPMDQNKAREELGLNLKDKYVCFVGNLAPWQGVDYLIRAAPLIVKKIPDAKFLIVGDGIMMGEWKKMTAEFNVKEHFTFTGAVPFEIVPKYINASDLCVVPKKILTSGYSPLKLYEYMACGKPIIATRTDGFEILEQCDAGLLINPDDPESFSNAIFTLVLDKGLCDSMGKNARNYVVLEYSWTKTAKNIIEICRQN